MRRSRIPEEVRLTPAKQAPATAITLLAAAVAVGGAIVAVAAARSVRRSHAGVEVVVVDGSVQRDLSSDLRRYRFTIRLGNHAATTRTIVAAGLRIVYRTRANFFGAVDLPLTVAEEPSALRAPLPLVSGEVLTRTVHVDTSNVVPRHCRVEGYALLLLDDGGVRRAVDASLAQVLRDDHDGEGPRTWGWD